MAGMLAEGCSPVRCSGADVGHGASPQPAHPHARRKSGRSTASPVSPASPTAERHATTCHAALWTGGSSSSPSFVTAVAVVLGFVVFIFEGTQVAIPFWLIICACMRI